MPRSSRFVGTNAAQSRTTSQPAACASAIHSSGCWTPEKFDCAGYANRLWRPRSPSRRDSSERLLVDAELRCRARQVRRRRTGSARVLAQAVHRVVVVEREQQLAAGLERVGLCHELQRTARVRREDDAVLGRGRVEVSEHRVTGSLDELGRGQRGRVDRVRVAEHVLTQLLHVRAQLRFGVEPSAGVVEIDLVLHVESRVLGRPKLVQTTRRVELGIATSEGREGLRLALRRERRGAGLAPRQEVARGRLRRGRRAQAEDDPTPSVVRTTDGAKASVLPCAGRETGAVRSPTTLGRPPWPPEPRSARPS